MLTDEVKNYLGFACCAGFEMDQIVSDLREICGFEYNDEAAHYFEQYCRQFDSIWASLDAHESMDLMRRMNQMYVIHW